ncbi:hypothetical protein E2562_038049 [Oryza meyeriana var. granulata]|uniref:Uncharacterized protein n=1 Tax=Oryza meyeriana var. granulata TaxID=110450 RepID=A0A6G1EU94_9ORYZ|nr:hypothetical protein E2562_038049 [Oryza meyeriana var. granulata]
MDVKGEETGEASSSADMVQAGIFKDKAADVQNTSISYDDFAYQTGYAQREVANYSEMVHGPPTIGDEDFMAMDSTHSNYHYVCYIEREYNDKKNGMIDLMQEDGLQEDEEEDENSKKHWQLHVFASMEYNKGYPLAEKEHGPETRGDIQHQEEIVHQNSKDQLCEEDIENFLASQESVQGDDPKSVPEIDPKYVLEINMPIMK